MADFAVNKTTTLAGAAEVITVQLTATKQGLVKFYGVYVDSTVATSFTIEIDGTAATSTALTPVGINPSNGYTPAITAWSASNVGTGSVVARFSIAANSGLFFDLSNVVLSGNNINTNLTVRSSSITGTVDINIFGAEVV